jgi:TRAP-type C4-dicarboxylate transport system permease large subunit
VIPVAAATGQAAGTAAPSLVRKAPESGSTGEAAGMSGSATADAAGLGQVEIKAMNDQGYPPAFSAAVTAASSAIGPIIPPSIPAIIFGATAGVSIGKLLIGGFCLV